RRRGDHRLHARAHRALQVPEDDRFRRGHSAQPEWQDPQAPAARALLEGTRAQHLTPSGVRAHQPAAMPAGCRSAIIGGLAPERTMANELILTLSCPDRRGIVHAVSGFLLEHGNNILEARQFEDRSTGLFFMRVQFSAGDEASTESFTDAFATTAAEFGMRFAFRLAGRPVPTAILVSRQGHCLNDLL